MAKKKKRKTPTKKGFDYYTEIYGIILILVGVIGFGQYGFIGSMIRAFAIFLAGSYSFIPLVLIMVLGGYMVIKRSYPDFFTIKLVGLYMFIIAILVLAHLNFITINNVESSVVISETIDNFMVAARNPDATVGGGIIGAIFGLLFVKGFDVRGAEIVTYVIGLFGVLLFFNLSLVEMFKSLKERYDNHNEERKKNAEEKAFDKPKKTVISNIDELKEKDNKDTSDNKPVPLAKARTSHGNYKFPGLDLLHVRDDENGEINKAEIDGNITLLEKTLEDFDISGEVVNVHVGPTVTQYEMELKAGTKVNKILAIQKEIALALAAKEVRVQAPIPGKSTIGVEIPNKKPEMVGLKEILENVPKKAGDAKLLVGLGKDIMGVPRFTEVNTTPHLLVAGATGCGKSVCINTILASILLRATPDEVKLVLIDPKKVELTVFNDVPHLLMPVVNDPKKASVALNKIVDIMDKRYDKFKDSNTKNIAGYNSYVKSKNKKLKDGEIPEEELPYIVVVIDELADLMLVAAKEVEGSIMRITQMARAAGIHLIVATQRPSTDVITGVIKANIPSRISFAVSSSIDSRTILDQVGAEKLLGKGDMLFKPMEENTPIRIQGAFISEEEVKAIVDFVKEQRDVEYDTTYKLEDNYNASDNNGGNVDDYDDPIYDDVMEFVISSGKASASLLQRRFRLGYNRAARLIDLLEDRGIIGPANGSKPREVLVKLESEEEEEE